MADDHELGNQDTELDSLELGVLLLQDLLLSHNQPQFSLVTLHLLVFLMKSLDPLRGHADHICEIHTQLEPSPFLRTRVLTRPAKFGDVNPVDSHHLDASIVKLLVAGIVRIISGIRFLLPYAGAVLIMLSCLLHIYLL